MNLIASAKARIIARVSFVAGTGIIAGMFAFGAAPASADSTWDAPAPVAAADSTWDLTSGDDSTWDTPKPAPVADDSTWDTPTPAPVGDDSTWD